MARYEFGLVVGSDSLTEYGAGGAEAWEGLQKFFDPTGTAAAGSL